MNTNTRDYTLQLLADRATEGLSSEKQSELDGLLRAHPDIDEFEFELASAALELAFLDDSEEMPAHMKARVAQTVPASLQLVDPASSPATATASTSTSTSTSTSASAPTPVPAPTPTPAPAAKLHGATPPISAEPPRVVPITEAQTRRDVAAGEGEGGVGVGRWLPWLVAAAAVLFAVMTGLNRDSNQDRAENTPPSETPSEAPATPPTPLELRTALVAEATDLFQMNWTATEDGYASGAGGDVVWSDSRNEGYMRISGLHVNDPSVDQYQLWVFDKTRDERYPVDGGVFDVTGGEVIIPIDPKIAVDEAFLFAITVEKPGGVVVSDRERIVLLAQRG